MDRGELARFLYAAERSSPMHAAETVLDDERSSTKSIHTCSAPRSSWPCSTPASRCATSKSPPDTRRPTHHHDLRPTPREPRPTPPTQSSPMSPTADQRT